MSILDDLAAPPPKQVTFAAWRAVQEPVVITALEKAALDPRWTDTGLEKILRKHGARVSKDSVERWRAELGYKG